MRPVSDTVLFEFARGKKKNNKGKTRQENQFIKQK